MTRRSRRQGRSKTKRSAPVKAIPHKTKLVTLRKSNNKIQRRKTYVRGKSKLKKTARKTKSKKRVCIKAEMKLGKCPTSDQAKLDSAVENGENSVYGAQKSQSSQAMVTSESELNDIKNESSEGYHLSIVAENIEIDDDETCLTGDINSDKAFPVMEDAQVDEQEVLKDQDKCDAQPFFNCSVCKKNFDSTTALTVHIKMHNAGSQVHKCAVCSKILSSASSLDRHMLVHSGERPFKCKLCDMAFTTNGNMHRHMRTHGEFLEIAENKGIDLRKKEVKKKFSSDSSSISETSSEPSSNREQEKLHCPVCGKTFLCKYGLQSHMETHPDDPILCQRCGEISSNYVIYSNHKCNNLEKKVENPKNICCGFHDLNFIDFSSNKFSLVSKSFCEQKIKRPSSAFHTFECPECKKAFPCSRALKLHMNSHCCKSGTFCVSCNCNFAAPEFLQLHQLKHRSAEQFTWNSHDDKEAETEGQACSGKEDFLALFNLQTKESHLSLLKGIKSCCVKEGAFENINYFVHGCEKKDDGKDEHNNTSSNDFADIQSIISLTSKAPLMTAVQSSPISACPVSPIAAASPQQPSSPQLTESANVSSETISSLGAARQANKKYASDLSVSSSSTYSCKVCAQKFYNISTLKRHNKLHVQRGSNYSCHLCSYVSVDKSTLIRHLRTHNGERPFQCIICKYAFTTKANCERHVRKRHKKTTKPEIRSCMQYNPNMVLKTSEVSSPDIGNNETVCKYCNVDFKFNRVLRHHLRSLHNSCNRKPFNCKICSFGFSTKNNCIRHVLKQHPGMKDRLRSVVVPNSQRISSEVSGTESDNTTDTFHRESMLNTPSLSNASDEQPVPPDDDEENGQEPLNLHITGVCVECPPNETVIAAESLVSLSETLPSQEEPLDLAVRPLDLTTNSQFLISQKFVSKPVSIYTICRGTSSEPDNSLDLSTPRAFLGDPTNCVAKNSDFSIKPVSETAHYPKTIAVNRPVAQKFRAFTCVYCSAGFTLKSNMERHIKRKHPEYARPTRSRNFIPTVVAHHPQRHNFTMLSDKTRDALRHVLSSKVHHNVTFTTHSHLPNVYGSPKKPVYLNANSMFNKKVNFSSSRDAGDLSLQKHIENSDISNDYKSQSCDVPEDENSSDLASVSSVICIANSQQFGQFFEKSVSDKNELTQGKKVLSPETNSPDSIRSTQASVSCPFCSRKFPWSSSLRRHILTHTGQKPYKCPRCALWFTTKSNCERHLIRKHGHKGDLIYRTVPGRPYKCKHCPSSTFATQGNLRKHFYLKHWTRSCLGMNSKPIGKRDDNSKLSDNSFASQSVDSTQTCKDHSYSHSETLKQCKCHFCCESFEDISGLSDHMKNHQHVIYMCYLCRKTFSTSDSCSSHFKTSHSLVYMQMVQNEAFNVSSDESCEEISNETSPDSSGLPMACMLCFHRLSSLDDLQQHVKKHLNIKPSCDVVDRSSNSLQSKPEASINKKVQAKKRLKNSLLYLFTPTGNANQSSMNSDSKSEKTLVEDGSDLIQNLLGIQDSKMIDEMLVSADSAARLLGVEEV